jgi:DNA-binding transcriptional ArsR family regulator
MRRSEHPDLSEIGLTEVMAALSDPIRVGLVRVLADGEERGWGELRAPIAKSTLSHHLRVLRNAGLTKTRKEGTRCWVTLRGDDVEARFPGLLYAVVAAAEADGTGHQVSLDTPDGHAS